MPHSQRVPLSDLWESFLFKGLYLFFFDFPKAFLQAVNFILFYKFRKNLFYFTSCLFYFTKILLYRRYYHNFTWSSCLSFPGGASDKEPTFQFKRRDKGLMPGSGKSPGGGHSNPLQYSCLENPMDRGAWWAKFHGVAESRAWLRWLGAGWHAST